MGMLSEQDNTWFSDNQLTAPLQNPDNQLTGLPQNPGNPELPIFEEGKTAENPEQGACEQSPDR
jgi:hypothetical protein